MIYLDPHWPLFVKGYGYEKMTDHGFSFTPLSQAPPAADPFYVSWGENVQGMRHALIETGFFADAMHIDMHGLYENSSLNLASARGIMESFEAPVKWQSLDLRTKCQQVAREFTWKGVVIAGQYHNDRSIKRAGSAQDYYHFMDAMCAHFGGRAFVKLHPVIMGNKEEVTRITEIATRHGSHVGNVGISVLDECEFVVTYNSTIAVDAAMRGKQVFQYAPGYFWQTALVQYTQRSLPPAMAKYDPKLVCKTLDFLLWKYCFHKALPLPQMTAMLRSVKASNELFPLAEEFSYGAFLTR